MFVAMIPIPDRCVPGPRGSDYVTRVCYGFAAEDLWLALGATMPCVLAGVAAVKLWRRVRPAA